MPFSSSRRASLAVLTLYLVGGCGGGGSNGLAQNTPTETMKSLALVPFADPDATAHQRWEDIDDRPYADSFVDEFKYGAGQVTLYYEPNPKTPYFVGRIEATGLKPNFSYQLKLAGKPQNGVRGWGELGDDWSNEAIGYATRWWNDTTLANSTDAQIALNKKKSPDLQDSIYGYDYMGEFVTDVNGNAKVNFNGSKAYHIAWQDKQNRFTDKLYGVFDVGSTKAPFYGYGKSMPSEQIRLWYEWQSDRVHNVKLPNGVYHCRFLLTEETFHAENVESGGKWPTILASENYDEHGEPDTISENDIVFTIKQ